MIKEDKDVFLKVYAPWCSHCKRLAPTWLEVAEELSGVPDLLMADLDLTSNEIDGIPV